MVLKVFFYARYIGLETEQMLSRSQNPGMDDEEENYPDPYSPTTKEKDHHQQLQTDNMSTYNVENAQIRF